MAPLAFRRFGPSAGFGLGLWALAGLGCPSSASPGPQPLGAACAAYDLHLVTLVEDHGAAGEIDPRALLDVVLAIADARAACRQGEARALELYGRIELGPAVVSPFHRVLLH